MPERIEIVLQSQKYEIRPLQEQSIKDGLVRTDSEVKEGFVFTVSKENRQKVIEAIKQIEKMFENPELAITDGRLSRWIGTIESCLIPPVEITGPERLVSNKVA